MSQIKVLPSHLKRQAIIYVRQSSPLQVQRNTESKKRQYQLVDRAQGLGWSIAQCVVIDDDLGRSGAQSHNRPGYQRLISGIALREVGIVLGLEVSRLARNSLDWYQLLELAAAFDVLIADEDALYDPGDFNDRLLLGLKGTISEVELHQIRSRMVRGRLNKAQRGELTWPLPIGLDRDPLTKGPQVAVDESVRHTFQMVFHLFSRLRSIRAVLRYLRSAGLELPYRCHHRGLGSQVGWRQASYDALYQMLTNPTYAGAYCYGRREQEMDPLSHSRRIRRRQRQQWQVFLPEHHPGYISLAEFEANQRILADNRSRYPNSRGAARRGPALLQGLVSCQHCGRRIRVSYSKGEPYYTCDKTHQRFGEPVCNQASARRVDALVEELFLKVVNTDTLELSQCYHEKLGQEAALVDRGWQEKLKRLEYQADLARRRYESVDPANRLVAHTLETDWNQRLLELDRALQAHAAQQPTEQAIASTAAQMQEVVTHLRDYWYGEGVTTQDKKELIRCLIEGVSLERRGKVIRTVVNWYGGNSSELDVPKYLFSSPYLYHRIGELARCHTDSEIAALLNQDGVTTVKGKIWTPRRVMDFRLSNAIPSGFTTTQELRFAESGYVTSAEAAMQLAVSQSTIQKWYKLGILAGKHDGGQAPLWILWTEEVAERLAGGAVPDPRMVSVRQLLREQREGPDGIFAWIKEKGHTIYRLRRGSTLKFYILPTVCSTPPR